MKDEIVFTSEEEKNNYLSFITNEYNENKVDVLKDSWEVIKKINTRNPSSITKFFWEQYPGNAIVVGIIWLIPVGTVSLFTNILGAFLLVSGLLTFNSKNNKFRGLIPAFFSLLASPFILGKNLLRSIHMKNIYKKKINEINSYSIEMENENEKNDRNVVVSSLLEKIESDDKDYSFMEIISTLERIKRKILEIKDNKKSEIYINDLYIICVFIERIMNLSEDRKIEALRFIRNELSKIENSVDLEIKEKEDILEEEYHQTKYLSRG